MVQKWHLKTKEEIDELKRGLTDESKKREKSEAWWNPTDPTNLDGNQPKKSKKIRCFPMIFTFVSIRLK